MDGNEGNSNIQSADYSDCRRFFVRKDPQTHAILGAAMEAHRRLGHGFLEAVYQAALAIEFVDREIEFRAEVALPLHYKGKLLTCSYRADFICFESVLVDTKAIAQLTGDREQVINALRATGFSRGLLINFGTRSLQYTSDLCSIPITICENLRNLRMKSRFEFVRFVTTLY
jgi:GxxExxY protein